MSDDGAKNEWMRTGPVHKSSREMREIGNLEEANRDGRLVGRKLKIGLDLNDLGIFIKKWVISGRMTTNPEITAKITRIGKNLGNWLGVTAIRDD